MADAHETTRTPPAPPAELWGLWMPTEGAWLNHIDGPRERYAAPMTFVDRDDAEETARMLHERDAIGTLHELVVARVGVAPPESTDA
jgi:hypothetical protein